MGAFCLLPSAFPSRLASFLHAGAPWPIQLSNIQNHGRLENLWSCSIAGCAVWLIEIAWDGCEISGTRNCCASQSTFWTPRTEDWKFQVPSSKFRRSSKLQPSRLGRILLRAVTCPRISEFLWNLELGIWGFPIPLLSLFGKSLEFRVADQNVTFDYADLRIRVLQVRARV